MTTANVLAKTPKKLKTFIAFCLPLVLNLTLPVLAEDSLTKIGKVLEVTENQNNGFREQIVKVEILDSEEENQIIFLNNNVPDSKAYAISAVPGKKYLLSFENNQEDIYITDYYREPVIIGLIIMFCLLVIFFGSFKGVKALLSLGLTGISIIYILIPGIKHGYSPLWLAILISAIATATTMVLIAGFSKKSLAATIGTTGGVAAAGIIAFIVIKLAPLSGYASSEAHILLANPAQGSFNFQSILAAGILISSLGAAMDVAISIASANQEIYETDFNQSSKQLFDHAINIGRDIMGTMTNTLILAYTGASIPLFLLLYAEPGLRVLNMEIIATELTSALVGSIGILLAIPITAFVSTLLLKSDKAGLPHRRHLE